jgi:hypothetical protein
MNVPNAYDPTIRVVVDKWKRMLDKPVDLGDRMPVCPQSMCPELRLRPEVISSSHRQHSCLIRILLGTCLQLRSKYCVPGPMSLVKAVQEIG